MNATTCFEPALEDYIDIVDTAVATVSRRLPAHVDRDDLASVGKIALLAAMHQVDGPPDEIRSYCFVRVRGAILDELRRLDPLSRRSRDLINKVNRAQAELSSRLTRTPLRAEIAAAAGVTVHEVARAQALVAEAEETPPPAPWETLADTAMASPADQVAAEDLRDALRSALSRLPDMQAHVLFRYYFDGATLEQIADESGVSKERIRQIRAAAEAKLRGDYAVHAVWQARVSLAHVS
ncbi:sigma-70 family RNA polymerase sigma factor [Nibricoccus sp. IMCC34717]|uniref:sigma-70 family RNA polymerase sigma factor n=1 Tax=Nibricoccus sp. IMCC34717 TaxID=3034021 RepID=UPI00384EE97B